MLQGLQDARKELPSKYFYDDVGSQLFEQICELDEYYLTRTELGIMQERMAEIVALLGPNCLLIEYGSGSSTKIRMLLDAMQDPAGYVPIDIAKEQLLRSATSLALAYAELEVLPVCADYTSDFVCPCPENPSCVGSPTFLDRPSATLIVSRPDTFCTRLPGSVRVVVCSSVWI